MTTSSSPMRPERLRERPTARGPALALALAAAACAGTGCRPSPEPVWRAAAAAAVPTAARAEAEASRQAAQFQRFALNALLAPLLDDAEPPRWADPSVTLDCAPGTAVTLDDGPLPVGAPLPARAFTLRWRLDDCRPWGGVLPALHGELELDVYPEDDRLSAVVRPAGLRLETLGRMSPVQAPFAAALALGPRWPP